MTNHHCQPSLFRRLIPAALSLLLLFAGSKTAFAGQAETIEIKMATLAPSGSPYHEIIKEMGARWREVSGGRVKLKIYPGGVAGAESDIVRKIRIGQLHAGALSVSGLNRIVPEIDVLSIPLAFPSAEALERAQVELNPKIEALLEKQGFIVLNWAIAGWVKFFVTDADPSVSKVQKDKLLVLSGDDRALEIWKTIGFNVVPLPGTDILTGLQSGMIDAYFTSPIMAYASQWFAFTPYMIDMVWAPMVGAIVVGKRMWNKIPEELRPELKAAAEKTTRKLELEMQRLETEAVLQMKKRGLVVITPDQEQLAGWHAVMRGAYPKMRGQLIPEDWFDIALNASP